MKKITIQLFATAIIGTVAFLPAINAATKDQQPAEEANGINLDMIYMPGKGNGVCNDENGAKNSCMVDVIVTDANGGIRSGFGVFVGNGLITTNYDLVTGIQANGFAVKPGDGHTYTVTLGDGTKREARPWAFVPGTVAVLRMH